MRWSGIRTCSPEAALRRILAPPATDGRLRELFKYAGQHGIPLDVLIDEYDHFANTVLAHRGREACESFTHGGGFYRNFFATLEAGTGGEGGGLERLFVTGVSPITMDDVTSGFNIGENVTLEPKFNDLLGFTEAEVRGLLALYRERGAFDQDGDAALAVMREWYNGYRSEPCRIVRETLWLKPEEEGAGIERERPRFPSPPGRPMDGWWRCCNRKREVRSVGSVGL